jgi:aerobic carbon-monoxide dehydrogenase medium subunit
VNMSAADAAALADEGTEPSADVNASAEFRRHLARVLVRRAIDEAG